MLNVIIVNYSGETNIINQIGDYCIKIAASCGISTDALMTENPSINAGCSNLQPGQVLYIIGVKTPKQERDARDLISAVKARLPCSVTTQTIKKSIAPQTIKKTL
jgi:hypothetical protein